MEIIAPVQGETKTYTHQEYYVTNEVGDLKLKIRCSWDKDRIFIRSVARYQDDKFVPIKDIYLSNAANTEWLDLIPRVDSGDGIDEGNVISDVVSEPILNAEKVNNKI